MSLPMVIIPKSSLSVSGSLLVEAWGWKHCLELVVAAIQNRHCWIGRVIRVRMEV